MGLRGVGKKYTGLFVLRGFICFPNGDVREISGEALNKIFIKVPSLSF